MRGAHTKALHRKRHLEKMRCLGIYPVIFAYISAKILKRFGKTDNECLRHQFSRSLLSDSPAFLALMIREVSARM